jgi:PhoPQ-activated pathogenicity-related protein
MQLYIHDLPGDTWLHIDPNAGHGLANYERVLTTLSGFYLHVVGVLALKPIHTGLRENGDSAMLTVKANALVASMNLWRAHDATTDFRHALWECQSTGLGISRTFAIDRPPAGFAAVYGEIEYRVLGMDIVLDTPVYVIEPAR